MCSAVEQLVNIIKTYNLPCHLQGQTPNGSKQRAQANTAGEGAGSALRGGAHTTWLNVSKTSVHSENKHLKIQVKANLIVKLTAFSTSHFCLQKHLRFSPLMLEILAITLCAAFILHDLHNWLFTSSMRAGETLISP